MIPNALVIGCGSIGQRHIGNLKKFGIEVAGFDPREDRRRDTENKLEIRTHADLASALRARVSTVFVCSPTHLHAEHALMAARAGSNLFIEKPISHTQDGLDELQAEVDRNRLHTLTACNFRFHPGLRKVKLLLEQGVIGKVTSIHVHFGQYLPDWHPWEDYRNGYSAQKAMGGGILLDRIHEIDYLRWLFGDIKEVHALAGKLGHLDIDVEDTVDALLRFHSGAFASVHLDYVRRTYTCSLDVTGESGTILWAYEKQEVRWYTAADRVWHSMQWPGYDGNSMYLDQVKHFMDAIAGLERSEQDIHEARKALDIALAIKKAADEHRGVTI